MRYEYVDDRAVFLLDNPKSDQPSKRNLSLAGLAIARPVVDRLFDAVCRQTWGQSRSTQDVYVQSFLKPLLAFFREGPLSYPTTSNEWQRLLVNFLRFYLIDRSSSGHSVRTRILHWRGVAMPTFAFWIEENIIPGDVEVPVIDFRSEPNGAPAPALLGESPVRTVKHAESLQKLLVDVGFGETDGDYLSRIERQCEEKISVLRTVCLKHWAAMRADHRTGRAFAGEIAATRIEACERDGRYREQSPRKGKRVMVTSPLLPEGHLWALAVATRLLNSRENLASISLESLRRSPFFGPRAFCGGPYYPTLSARSALPVGAHTLMTRSTQFYRFFGILSGIDVAAACALLMMEHPQFTPMSLTNAQLLDVRGRSFLEATDGALTARFSVDKPRAGARKGAVLSTLSHEIITYLIEVTAPIRARMKASGHKAWRYLFLGQQSAGRIGPLKAEISTYLTFDRFSLVRLYPELEAAGLRRGTLDFRRLRNTLGVLRWFATGSITEMSRSLGNTHQVALEHYLPPALLQAWNIRIIRRFQNTLILLAAHDEEYLLAATDFSTLGDLLHFMAQLIHDHRDGTSPIATEIHARLGGLIPQAMSAPEPCIDRLLNVRCSARALAYLYAFEEYSGRLDPSRRVAVDPSSGLAPQSFIDLARMIRHACENREVTAAMRELLDVKRLRKFHHAALAQQAELRAQFSRFTLNQAWAS